MKANTQTRDNDWFEKAACRGLDPAMFYPEDVTQWHEARKVKQVCAECPVRRECMDYAISSPYIEEGYWGCSEEDRDHLRKTYKGLLAEAEQAISVVAVELLSV